MGFFDIFSTREETKEPVQAQLFARVSGKVQGVGFRWWVAGQAKPLNLVGYTKNLDDGSVEILAQGSHESCQQLLASLRGKDTAGRVDQVEAEITQPVGSYKNFGIY